MRWRDDDDWDASAIGTLRGAVHARSARRLRPSRLLLPSVGRRRSPIVPLRRSPGGGGSGGAEQPDPIRISDVPPRARSPLGQRFGSRGRTHDFPLGARTFQLRIRRVPGRDTRALRHLVERDAVVARRAAVRGGAPDRDIAEPVGEVPRATLRVVQSRCGTGGFSCGRILQDGKAVRAMQARLGSAERASGALLRAA